MSSQPTISAFIVCNNEEQHIRRCLESVRWCDEVVAIVDTKSVDRTHEICQELADKVVRHPWSGFVQQKAFGLTQCSGDWILNLDADEEVSPELRVEIVQRLREPLGDVNGFYLLRVVFHLNRWWRTGGWYPEYRLRLCRRTATVWGGSDPHEKAEVTGTTSRLKGELRHYTYNDLADQVNTLNSFSTLGARTLSTSSRTPSLFTMIANPCARFLKFFIWKQGYKEGRAGLIVAILESYYVFLKYAKLWELTALPKRVTPALNQETAAPAARDASAFPGPSDPSAERVSS